MAVAGDGSDGTDAA